MTAVTLNAVSKVYPGGHRAVDELRLRIEDGEFFVLLGPSGCGKSTVLRMIAGLEEITSGELWLDDRYANELSPRERNVAMVFQNSALYPHFSVRGNLAFPLELARADQAGIREKVVEMARALGIDPTLDRKPGTLSGGQRQRVAIGRAIIREPDLFLMDEPLSNLDAALRADLRLEIGALARSLGVTTIYVTHDQVEALTLADRIAILRDGVLQDVGTPAQIYRDPATAFVASFLGTPPINLLSATVWAVQGQGVRLTTGVQALVLPWADPRARALAGYHRDQVIIGIRPDAVALAKEPVPDRTLSGRVHALEFHGHEWLAQVEAGVTVADIDKIGRPAARPVAVKRSGRTVLSRILRNGGVAHEAEPEPAGPHVGTHRRSDLLVRLPSVDGWHRGAEIDLSIDLPEIRFFDRNGRRIGPAAQR